MKIKQPTIYRILNSRRALALSGLVLAACGTTVSGAVLAYDGFAIGANDYTANVNLDAGADGQVGVGSGPLNMAGTWTHDDFMFSTTDAVASTVNLKTTASGLDFGSWDQGSGAVVSFRSNSNASAQFTPIHYQSLISGNQQILGTESVYFSALVNYTAGYGAGVGIEFDDRTSGTNRKPFGVGVDGNGEALIWAEAGGSTFADGSYVLNRTSGLGLTAGTTYMIVGKMVGNTGATTNPETIELLGVFDAGSVATSEPISPLLTATADVYFDLSGTPEGRTLEAALIWGGKSATGEVARIDEVVIGKFYEDVVPVPEPSQVALALGMLISGAILIRRRRS